MYVLHEIYLNDVLYLYSIGKYDQTKTIPCVKSN